jgi:hypothetical protein
MLPVSGNAIDLVVDPYQGALYVAFSSQGIFKSTDLTGVQWKALGGCLPTSGFGRIALAFGGRGGLGFSQPLPLVYAGFDAKGTYRLFVTKDGGDSWSELPSPPSDGQLGFNNVITVGPYNSDEVYIGQIAFWRSLDGGRKGGRNDYHVSPPVESNSWTVLGCCLSDSNPFRKNLDLHGDLHAIEFAPYGSFGPSPSQIQIVFVASDGGITKGSFDSTGMVSWEPLTKGLAVGQAGTIGLSPVLPSVTVAGYWHNGDILTVRQLGFSDDLAIMGGDGFQSSIDAQGLTLYLNCNAGCRIDLPRPAASAVLRQLQDRNDLVRQQCAEALERSAASRASAPVAEKRACLPHYHRRLSGRQRIEHFRRLGGRRSILGKDRTDHDNGFPQPRVGASTGLLPWYRYWPSLARLS